MRPGQAKGPSVQSGGGGGGTGDHKIMVSAADTTPAFAESKILAGTGISVTKENTGLNEDLKIAAAAVAPIDYFSSSIIDGFIGGGGPLIVDYLIVAGGGGGGQNAGGGGGGGGVKSSSCLVASNTTYPVIPGVGGIGSNAAPGKGQVGLPSSFNGITALGGGGGGSLLSDGEGGGSGGGGGANLAPPSEVQTGGTAIGGVGEGNDGGNGDDTSAIPELSGGGGGGQSAAGTDGTIPKGGDGGEGYTSSISGAPVVYGSGGGGGTYTATRGLGGTNAGNGGYPPNPSGTPPVDYTGGGGSGNCYTIFQAHNGGIGVVIISYPTGMFGGFDATGGTITYVSGKTIHTFTSPGSFITPVVIAPPSASGNIIYLKDLNLVTVWFNIGGVSNSTLLSFTLPYANAVGSDIVTLSVLVIDDSVLQTNPGLLIMNSGSSMVNLFLDGKMNPWTASGQKQVAGIFSYYV